MGLRITVWFYQRLGRSLARLLLWPIVTYFFLTGRTARRASQQYLERLYHSGTGSTPLDRPARARHVFRHFFEFGITTLDRIGFWLGNHDDFVFQVHGQCHLDQIATARKGALILGSHLGSFDAMQLLGDQESPLDIHILTYTRHAERINRLIRQLSRHSSRSRARVRVLGVDPNGFDHAFKLRKCIEQGQVAAILADRVPPSDHPQQAAVKFLGAAARFPHGPFRLASLLQCPVYLMFALRAGDRHYDIYVEPFVPRVELPPHQRSEALLEYCQAYADRLAHYCAKAPYQWFNFFPYWESSREDSHD